jgi:catechol 2,3-dioxygenase-like lactoylglutathione lyase family enzyme
MDMKLEVVAIPVSDVDRAKSFYEKLGWRMDGDFVMGEGLRVVQFTPPGSAASIFIGQGLTSAVPGSIDGLLLVVKDIYAARAELISRGVEVSEVFHGLGGLFHQSGTAERLPGPDPQRNSYWSYASFSDPDGNVWTLQEVTERLPGR